MRAIVFDQPGDADVLKCQEVPMPVPSENQVLIKVLAAGINRPDVLQRLGLYPPPPDANPGLGLEVSGHIEALGAGVKTWQVGEAVCALTHGGGYADYVLVDAGSVMAAPKGISLRDAAALPETVLTVWQNVFAKAGLKPGETLLVHGATSGIGTTAIQMAKAHGARVIATARHDDKAAFGRALGADIVINTQKEDFAAIAREAGGVDVVLDMVGGEFLEGNIAALNPGGRLALIAFLGGYEARINLIPVLQKHLHIMGSTLRPLSLAAKAALCRAVEKQVWPWVAAGKLAPVIDQTFALCEAAKAHAYLESGVHKGKLLLIP
ncbi:MAG: NAD(P)H-quinone oxidoreductase [Robiginitomaculum sp.]|nr:NAD(P)H-quinone oxidoreductase [Robiginitomaculum sp.]MDQ7077887.1 NAD(P)H-quinone oxidoreductase [Robiginitomaculum sp.]